jgi:hypothetical protein
VLLLLGQNRTLGAVFVFAAANQINCLACETKTAYSPNGSSISSRFLFAPSIRTVLNRSASCAGVPIARDAALVEARIDLIITKDASLGVSYQGQFGDGATRNGFNARLQVTFRPTPCLKPLGSQSPHDLRRSWFQELPGSEVFGGWQMLSFHFDSVAAISLVG